MGRYGSGESFLEAVKGTPIVDSIHYVSGIDNSYHISRVMQISEFSREMWKEKGGDDTRSVIISLPLFLPDFNFTDIRPKLGLQHDTFIYGFHQANRDEIFSEIPLLAYKEVENDRNAFVICNGSRKYRTQAQSLGLKNIYFFDYLANDDEFYSVIKSFDVYAHGRKDGELNSAAIAEALSFGLPVITHPSDDFNGHLEVVKDNGFVASDVKEYAKCMKELEENKELREKCGRASRKLFETKYNLKAQIDNIIKIYEDVLQNPYPNKGKRIFLDIKQNTRDLFMKGIIRLLYLK